MYNVEIYTSDTCGYCHMAKNFFDINKIEYVEHNISKNLNDKKTLISMGILSVPYIIINGEGILGFDEIKVKRLLNL